MFSTPERLCPLCFHSVKQLHSFFIKFFVWKKTTSYSKKFTNKSRIKYWFGDVTIMACEWYANEKKKKSLRLIKMFINEHSIFYGDIAV